MSYSSSNLSSEKINCTPVDFDIISSLLHVIHWDSRSESGTMYVRACHGDRLYVDDFINNYSRLLDSTILLKSLAIILYTLQFYLFRNTYTKEIMSLICENYIEINASVGIKGK